MCSMPRQSGLYTRWSREMRRSELFRPGERVGVAVSGGPDSMLLLEFMKDLARDLGLALAVIHFNHHLRGAESDGDERFVRERAGQLRIEFHQGEADVAAQARDKHRNLEATAARSSLSFFLLAGQSTKAGQGGHRAHGQRSGRNGAFAAFAGNRHARAGRHLSDSRWQNCAAVS